MAAYYDSEGYDTTPDVGKELKTSLFEVKEEAEKLLQFIDGLTKKTTPVYSKYKPFKDISEGTTFILRTHRYLRTEESYYLGNKYNVKDLTNNQYDYISDYEWVIELD